jgi:hypothetical protein
MTRTPYSTDNAEFSNRCHQLAQKIIYPRLFDSAESIEYRDTLLGDSARGRVLDGELAVDRTVIVDSGTGFGSFEYYMQERFRRPRFAKWRDATITKWNNNSDLPSELYKIKSGYFVYGYANHLKHPTDFIEVVVFQVVPVLKAIAEKRLESTTENNHRTNQDFICVLFNNLLSGGYVDLHYRPPNNDQYSLGV